MHIHFMGIGGSGVSGLATAAKSFGYNVSGCDLKESSFLKMVRDQGIKCMIGHDPAHLDGVDILVRSSAVSLDNPEVAEAFKKGIKVVTRGEFLAILLEKKHKIGVGGSHGKTSTTWMIYALLRAAGVEASVYAGGKSNGLTYEINDFKKGYYVVFLANANDDAVLEYDRICNIREDVIRHILVRE